MHGQRYITIAPIGVWEVKVEIMTDRPTNQQTTDRRKSGVSIPIPMHVIYFYSWLILLQTISKHFRFEEMNHGLRLESSHDMIVAVQGSTPQNIYYSLCNDCYKDILLLALICI